MIKVSDKESCCGCSACKSTCPRKAISMVPDDLGFFYPNINMDVCINCGLCEKVCPIKKRENCNEAPPPKKWYAARHQNEATLRESTSGGVFSALADYVIKNNGIVFGVCYNDNMRVIHSFAETSEDCKKFTGAKYVQSDIGNSYEKVKAFLKQDKIVLFTGTPCQIEGLRLFLKHDYEKLILVDIICHAVSSPKVFEEFVTYAEKKLGKKIVSIKMRDKTKKGWGHDTSTKYIFEDGKELIDPQNIKNWNYIYFSSFVNRPACSDCKFSNFQRSGDLTIGDFWDDKGVRQDLFDKKGTSLVLVNSNKGVNLIDKIESLNKWTLSFEDIQQLDFFHCCQKNPWANDFILYYKKKGFKYVYKRYINRSQFRNLLTQIKRIILELVK